MNDDMLKRIVAAIMSVMAVIATFKEMMIVSGLYWIAAAIFFANVSGGDE